MPKRRPRILPSLRTSSKSRRRIHRAQGEVPGTIVVEPDADQPRIMGTGYSDSKMTRQELEPDQIREFSDQWPVCWIDVEGLGDADTISQVGEVFGLHSLALEDAAHPHERAKVEEYENYLFIIARMAHQEGRDVHIEQLSMFLGKDWVITFQEQGGDAFDPVRQRIKQGRGRIRRSRADYLAYALLDSITDAYFPILDEFASLMERLEAQIVGGDSSEKELIPALYESRRALSPVRRAVLPLRDVVRFLEKESGGHISEDTKVYLRDVDDHLSIINEQVEHLRELSASLMDVHYTMVTHKMNEGMRALTVIATVFLPLSFVAGLYGMNFDTSSPYNMPELGWRYGYPFALLLMVGIIAAMMLYFRRKDWF